MICLQKALNMNLLTYLKPEYETCNNCLINSYKLIDFGVCTINLFLGLID